MRIKQIIKTIAFGLKNEGLLPLVANIIKYLPWKKHPSRLIDQNSVLAKIETVYLTPAKLIIKGWAYSKEGIQNISLRINEATLDMTTLLKRPDISERYDINIHCGFYYQGPNDNLIIDDFANCVLSIKLTNGSGIEVSKDLRILIEESRPQIFQKGLVKSSYRMKVTSTRSTNRTIDILIPFKNEKALLEQLLNSIEKFTVHTDYHIILLNNQTDDPLTLKYISEVITANSRISVIDIDEPFNYSKIINKGIKNSSAQLILLLNNDTEVITKGWLVKLSAFFNDENVSVVGVKLLYPDRTIQHAGIELSRKILTRHIWIHFPNNQQANHPINITRQISAVTGACMMIRRKDVEQYGGMDETLGVTLNDIDYCLRMWERNHKTIYAHDTVLVHYESHSRGNEDTMENYERTKREVSIFRSRWEKFMHNEYPPKQN